MQIVAPGSIRDPLRKVREHDRILLRLLAQRAHEWQSIKIALWAWKETARQQRKSLRKLE
jgi:hypothetical protein